MPRAAIELGVVDLVLPLPQIAGAIVDAVARKPLAAV
jgi:chemotaxis response regulator CheB